jgi:RimJ/RimL family protein N-acetyltransferase
MRLPELRSERLVIREFTLGDLSLVHQVLDLELDGALDFAERRRWLEWTLLAYDQLDKLNQPPYGDRAITLLASGELIGACGYAPCLAPFHEIPGLQAGAGYTSEVGLYWAISPRHQRHGYATEAGAALIVYAFSALRLGRIVATTDYTNAASIGVMRKLGMHVGRNTSDEPSWLQVVAHLESLPTHLRGSFHRRI